MRDLRYNTKRWQQLRARVIARDGKRCAVTGCLIDMTQPHMVHADHIVEVRGEDGPFWDERNIQVLCQVHHKAKTLDARARRPIKEPQSPNG